MNMYWNWPVMQSSVKTSNIHSKPYVDVHHTHKRTQYARYLGVDAELSKGVQLLCKRACLILGRESVWVYTCRRSVCTANSKCLSNFGCEKFS